MICGLLPRDFNTARPTASIATRSVAARKALPLARLRTRGQLIEIRAADLRFTAQEAATFLNDAMGLGLYFTEGEGPRFERPVRTVADVRQLAVPDMEEDLGYVMDAVGLIRRELDGRVPLIGFAGSPWTLATYMVEGGSAQQFARCKGMMFDRPELMHRLLDKLARAVTDYLNAQIAAGAQVHHSIRPRLDRGIELLQLALEARCVR